RRRARDDAIAAYEQVLGEMLRELAGLRVAEEDGVADVELHVASERERRLHLARAFERQELEAFGEPWFRKSIAAPSARGDEAAARLVLPAGDLRFVRHDAVNPQPGARADGVEEREHAVDVAHGAAPHADVEAISERAPRDVDVDDHRHDRRARARLGVERVE